MKTKGRREFFEDVAKYGGLAAIGMANLGRVTKAFAAEEKEGGNPPPSVEKVLKREDANLAEFGAHLEPKLRVKPGELFKVECQDNMFGKIDNEDILPTAEYLPELFKHQYWVVNPVAGPIYVEGLKKGDLLVFEIDDIIPLERGWTGIIPGVGALANNPEFPDLQKPFTRICHHKPGPSGTMSDGTGMFKVTREVTYPLRPFLGTIVTAPERGIENTLVSQGPWGGNLDCRDVCKGHKIMLNTGHDGGLLFFGDGHGAQADSELTGLADECAMDVFGRCHIVEQKTIPGVLRIETPTSLIQLDSARNAAGMERALNSAFIGMGKWLVEEHGMDSREAFIQFSVNPDVRINTYQFVIGFYVVGVEFPKKYL